MVSAQVILRPLGIIHKSIGIIHERMRGIKHKTWLGNKNRLGA
jgi:hypothetical protein